MKNQNTQLIVRTALLLAITLLFQQLRLILGVTPASTIIIGSLVNLALFVSAATVGWKGSIFVAALSPVVSALQGHLPHPLMIPFVAAGNLVLVIAFELVERRSNSTLRIGAGIAVAAVLKTITLYCLVVLLFVPSILPGLGLKAQVSKALVANFGVQQLFTAAIGGVVSIPVIKAVRRALDRRSNG